MGKCEFRYLYMHAMFWDTQKSRGTHIEGAFLISGIYTFTFLIDKIHRVVAAVTTFVLHSHIFIID